MGVTTDDILAMVPGIRKGTDVSWAIDAAHVIMEDSWKTANPPVLQNRQDIVEKFLAAHFLILNIEKGGLVHKSIGASSEGYTNSRANIGLQLTRYGQQAVALDPTRTLAQLDSASGGVAQFRVV